MTNLEFKALPIGIQTFETIIQDQYLYIDKTALIYELIKGGARYFLSRPRRFGKSLLLTTLEAFFEGKKELFSGLKIINLPYDWENHPVIRLDISRTNAMNENELREQLATLLQEKADIYEIKLAKTDVNFMLSSLIIELYQKTDKKVVILIDEYDSPLVNLLHKSDILDVLREILREFYRVTKSLDEYLRFVFVTGVTHFSKANMFSGLNHLHNISLNPTFGTLLGYTQDELEFYFSERLKISEEKMKKPKHELLREIKNWYDGYRFSADSEPVYNPFSTLQFFADQRFSNYWYQTGTPTFLVNIIEKTMIPKPPEYDQLFARENDFDTLILEQPSIVPLLYQTGYLTIKNYNSTANIYELGYPNQEVKQSFMESLLTSFTATQFASSEIFNFSEFLRKNEIDSLMQSLKRFFSSIPYDIHISKESYYQTIFYLIFQLLGYYIRVEVRTNKGRIDSILELDNAIYIIEFKLNGSADAALKQIEDKKYLMPFQNKDKELVLIGIDFDMEDRNIREWKVKYIKKS